MSKEAAVQFVTKFGNDESITEKIRSAGDSYSKERSEQAVRVGKENGFEFTAEELSAVAEQDVGELSDDDLAGVSGGRASIIKRLGQYVGGWLNGGSDDQGGSSGGHGVRG